MVTRASRAPSKAISHGRIRGRVLIIEAPYYAAVAGELARGAIAELEGAGVAYDRVEVPGALEIPQVLAQAVAAGLAPMSAASGCYCGVVVLGCVIRGETSHYDIVCNNANHWLMEIATRHGIPVGNAILTVDNEAQAMARAKGPAKGQGKGADAVRACLRLVEIGSEMREKANDG